MTAPARVLIWAEPTQDELIQGILQRASVDPVGVGTMGGAGAEQLASSLGVPVFRDLRAALNEVEADLLWLAAPQTLEAEERASIRGHSVITVTSQPRPGSIAELVSEPDEAATAHFMPLLRRSIALVSLPELLESFGQVRSVALSMRSRPEQRSLYAHLFDALDFIREIVGEAVEIDATVDRSADAVPETLAAMDGHLSANLRFAGSCVACLSACSASGDWFRGATIVGDGGTIRVCESGLSWINTTGELIESHGAAEPGDPTVAFAQAIQHWLERPAAEVATERVSQVLALCEAARLSCRTGQSESPSRLFDLMSRV